MDTTSAILWGASSITVSVIGAKIYNILKYKNIERIERAIRALDNQEELNQSLREQPIKYIQWFTENTMIILFFICLAQIFPYIHIMAETKKSLPILGGVLPAVFWTAGAMFSIMEYLRGLAVRYPERAKAKSDKKRKKLVKQLEELNKRR